MNVQVKLTGLSPSISHTITCLVCDNIEKNFIIGIGSMKDMKMDIYTSDSTIRIGEFKYNYSREVSSESSVCTIDENDRYKLDTLIKSYSTIFSTSVGTVPIFEYSLSFIDNSPPPAFHSKPFRIPIASLPDIKASMQEMLDNDIIAERTTQFTSNAFTVPKPDGASRLVIFF